ncbi:RND family transporter [Anaeromyxobacter sp. Fw109-5]|uniref:efflux RND transporter permease subunit n=1 Tax=Anaeromyxobacter sp. (strain Fw109-5) TaxID=404589 RepID=UPI000158A502|nr:MMPL family transporter [Anaeromyxobacter sp. Fw109-5]ABS27287.1 exporter of the RND superfamily protein-like protein [Anaeromyxobacter sp. Fw109-5]
MSRSRLERVFGTVVALRGPILVLYALLVPAAAWLAAGIPSEGAIDRLVVPSDPDFVATRELQRIFPERPLVVLLLEAEDPYRPRVLAQASAIEAALRALPGVTPVSILDAYARARGGAPPLEDPATAKALRRFATGTDFFRRQGLVGEGFLGVVVTFEATTPPARDAALAAIDRAVEGARGDAIARVRRVGGPYLESWIERESRDASRRHFPVFGLLVVAVALFLYRSWRALLAILLTLAAAVALAAGAGRLLGFSFTVVSAIVPLTVMVTTLASLVYLHSRFVDQPEGVPVEAHQLAALAGKFLPVTASSAAAVAGFAALAVSRIRPIREMGLWTAAGLAIAWVVALTLFPALQRALRTPTRRSVEIRARLYERVAGALPAFTWRWRRPLVAAALGLAAAGLVALVGVPGRVAPMEVGLDVLRYVDPSLPIHEDMLFFRRHVSGLNVARLWVRTPPGAITDPEVLRALDAFTTRVEAIPGVSSVVGPTSLLRLRRYAAGEPEALPRDPAAFAEAVADLEQLLLSEPELRAFVDVGTLANAQLTVVFERGDGPGVAALARAAREAWDRTAAEAPALRGAELRVAGESILAGKVGASLVPTLTESFAITAALVFAAFLLVFRSASARLLAMIPSLFAILVTFLAMRLAGGSLDVATILVATTVLGTTENDQIHFFHHLHEGEGSGGLDGALRHTLRVSGRAIVFATFINAAGFLALALSGFPPLRQFGVVTAGAFLLAMIADFTALPAALWIARGEAPATAPPPGRGASPRRYGWRA